MKVVVIGGTGLIGKKLVDKIKESGHEAVAASPSKGVNTLTGEGLDLVMKGAHVVVDVANSPSFEEKAVLEFFETSSRNLLAAEKKAGVSHHIALSVVGADLLPDSGYFRAKRLQENLIKSSGIPYTIVRATQFLEFLGSIAQSGTSGQTVRLPLAFLQPIASEDVANALFQISLEKPMNGILEIAGPDVFPIAEIVEKYLKATKDSRTVIPDPDESYFGSKLQDNTLIPHNKNPRLGSIGFKEWIAKQK